MIVASEQTESSLASTGLNFDKRLHKNPKKYCVYVLYASLLCTIKKIYPKILSMKCFINGTIKY